MAPLLTLSALVFILLQYPNFISSKNRMGNHYLIKIELNLGYSSTLKNLLLYPKFSSSLNKSCFPILFLEEIKLGYCSKIKTSALKINNDAIGIYLSLCILNSSIFNKSAANFE